ncbi:efflux transporter outer membrane subunit [Corallococcus terminator]|uniref:Efflux transporter outer membrane subunit n=1 Tax=Corallococcus terminator TaxID=2316733 RepID=A0A3A8J423_9BACT|nr:efflux transporter outer membrane subunit [Corallococcus terminator]RKG86914.1 efflux transporter outer membrane subunit [Corallococcus terminator]
MMHSRFRPRITALRAPVALLSAGLLSACAVGPDYKRPTVAVPTHFKEAADGWKPAQPNDRHDRGAWWKRFGDPELDALEARVARSNQTVASYEAAYRRARAMVAEARASLFPTLGASGSASRARGAGRSTTAPGGINAGTSTLGNIFDLSLDASWEPDLWGRVRRQVSGAKASAQAAGSDLDNAKLSAQAMLAQSYFQLRALDATQRLLDDAVVGYQKSLRLTQNRYVQGVAGRPDVLQAQTQLALAQAAATENEISRATYEHAIAVLVGEPASTFSLPRVPLAAIPPALPAELPSTLLERRPDIAAAERRAAAANEQIGVAISAWFPSLNLSASGGFTSSTLAQWFTAPHLVWALGPQLVATLFDGGLRASQTEQARAAYDQGVANYRQTVLAAFQDVEDNLVSLRVLEQEVGMQQEAVGYARQALEVVTNQYKAGTVTYLEVITAQATLYSSEQKLAAIAGQRMVSAVGLIKALGGGWDVSPPPHD